MGRKIQVINPLKGVDLDVSTKRLDQTMKDFIKESLKTFVIDSTNPIPVWSGASRASFKKLAAIARTRIDIVPVAPIDRRALGVDTSEGFLFVDDVHGLYGWQWSSDLDYIHIVDSRVDFVAKGIRAVENLKPNLPGVEVAYG
jgi:hypothetical protein